LPSKIVLIAATVLVAASALMAYIVVSNYLWKSPVVSPSDSFIPICSDIKNLDNAVVLVYLYSTPKRVVNFAGQTIDVSDLFMNKLPRNLFGTALDRICAVQLSALESLGIFNASLSNYTLYPVIMFVSRSIAAQIASGALQQLANYTYVIDGRFVLLTDAAQSAVYSSIAIIGDLLPIETPKKPSISELIPVKGSPNARFVLFVYEDLHCPYCAKLYSETLPELENLVDSGILAIAHKNLIVHSEVADLHRFLISVYAYGRDPQTFFRIVSEAYSRFERTRSLTLDDLKSIVSRYYDLSSISVISDADEILSEDMNEAWMYGIGGTPGFVLWDNKLNCGVVFVGFRDANQIVSLIDSLQKR